MKERKRAYRRHKKWVKFKKRLDLWTAKDTAFRVDRDWRDDILKGKVCTWMRTMSCPCSCIMCSGEKYNREQKQYVRKEMFEQIE